VLPEARVRILRSPGPDGVDLVLDAWREFRKPANLLLVMDGSASMADSAFADRSLTRLDAAKIAVRNALDRLDPEDAVGVWAISSASGRGGRAELGPVRPLGPAGGDRRTRLADRVNTLRARGGTPLYATPTTQYGRPRATTASTPCWCCRTERTVARAARRWTK